MERREEKLYVFGPVPSRRLGRSLGVNNIPKKVCSYDCVYCQLGKTRLCSVERRAYFNPYRIIPEVKERVEEVKEVDFITFVPDGEPTLDENLGVEIRGVGEFGRVAVITNSSLLFMDDVKEDLAEADLVSLKVDAASEEVWKSVNQPCEGLVFSDVMKGIIDFSKRFSGELITETMLVDGLNDSEEELRKIGEFLKELSPKTSYIAIPIRPPSYSSVRAASKDKVDRAYMIFDASGLNPKLLNVPEEGEFHLGSSPKEGILAITSVHPMREESLKKALEEVGADFSVVEELLRKRRLERLEYGGKVFYRKR